MNCRSIFRLLCGWSSCDLTNPWVKAKAISKIVNILYDKLTKVDLSYPNNEINRGTVRCIVEEDKISIVVIFCWKTDTGIAFCHIVETWYPRDSTVRLFLLRHKYHVHDKIEKIIIIKVLRWSWTYVDYFTLELGYQKIMLSIWIPVHMVHAQLGSKLVSTPIFVHVLEEIVLLPTPVYYRHPKTLYSCNWMGIHDRIIFTMLLQGTEISNFYKK